MTNEWPVYYRTELAIGDLESNVGICTLWTEKEGILADINKKLYCICGNLYSFWGINFIVRNILANPIIRYLVLCGADLTESGQALVNLFDKGIDGDGVIFGFKAKIDSQIPAEAIEKLRSAVKILDLRGIKDHRKISKEIKGLQRLSPFMEPQLFPEAKPLVEVLPSEKTGFRIEDKTVADAWLKILKLVMNFGEVKPSEYTVEQKELLNVIAVVTGEDPDNVFFAPWLPTTPAELENYYPKILSPQLPLPGIILSGIQLGFGERYHHPRESGAMTGVSYTYGGRLRNYRGVSHDQISAMIEQLRKVSYTRRAVAITWDALVDGGTDHPPCLIQLLTSVQKENLFLTAHFRSHDIYGAWPENVFALRKLQGQIASEVGVEIGPLTVISHSAHIYADRWQVTQEVLDRYYPESLTWVDDARGNFLIYTKDGTIIVEHSMTMEGKTGIRFEGRTARELYARIINSQLVSLPEHAAYLGSELKKAELALKLGFEYHQDKDIDIAPG